MSVRTVLDGILTALLLVVCGLMLVSEVQKWVRPPQAAAQTASKQPVKIPDEPIPLEGAQVRGKTTAPVSIVLFSEFHCPFCARLSEDVLPELERKFINTGVASLTFRHFPLEQIHPNAVRAATIAECAGAQGAFWPMHDRLFKEPKSLADAAVAGLAGQLNISAPDLFACLEDKPAQEAVQRDIQLGKSLGVRGTPTLFIGRPTLDGRVAVRSTVVGASFERLDDAVKAVAGEGSR